MFLIAAGIGAAGVIGGSILSANAAGHAADTQAGAARYAADLQNQQYQQTRQDQQPWRDAGNTALSQMGNPDFQKTFSMQDFQQDPGYQFRMDQGMQALQRSAAARGGLMNGGTLKGLTDYSQNAASNEYQNAYNRFNTDNSTRFNRLASIAGLGQTANGQTAAAGMNYANQAGEAAMGGANAQGAAGIAGANAISGGLSGLGNTAMQYGIMSRFNSHPFSSELASSNIANMPEGGYSDMGSAGGPLAPQYFTPYGE